MGRLLKVITTGPSLPANAGIEMAMSSEPQVLHLLAIDDTRVERSSCRYFAANSCRRFSKIVLAGKPIEQA